MRFLFQKRKGNVVNVALIGLKIYMGSSTQAVWTLGIGFASFLPGLFETHCHCYSHLRCKEEGSVISFQWEDRGVR